ncbi:dihydroxyacetone kinase subunit DhaK [Sporolactobacillus sp. THM19-2]|uniref:dihydroxyacetone kinase subunit DhaK n=1 Tax=Sporolactobacillus sp. THM19-2 TaxID=2511171 RepID=UPI0010229936|nr:dihydroxyacetone kinase subunit DhaK [Sporolactobacillus sp. THM19-2]RYL93270.1 dihydroxyacetone kinase subunit DhaK [Sporolactobacillus sp. THM19-2]
MKKIMNKPENIVDEMIDGLVFGSTDLIRRIPETNIVIRKKKSPGKVALVSGGGSGHEPTHAGYVGSGMLAAAVCGPVFTSPAPDQIVEAIKQSNQGAGVLLIIKNYSGDVMNFEMAEELAAMDGIKVDHLVVDDDIAVEDSTYTAGKRGVAGTVLVHKLLGAAAESGLSLEALKELGEKVVDSIKTIGVALSAGTVPESGKPGFILAEDEMEYGVGIHGEPGYHREKIKPSAAIARELIDHLRKAFQWKAGDPYGILVNGLGATPLMEQYVFANDVAKLLQADQLELPFRKIGNYMTSLEMAGLSLTLFHLQDSKWLDWLKAPVETTAW